MRGLMLNNYYSLQNNLKISFSIAVVLLLLSFAVVDMTMLNTIIAAQIMVFSVSIGASLQVDDASKWSRLEITLPVRRATIIRGKYLSFITLFVTGTAISVITALLLYLRDAAAFRSLDLSFGYMMGLSLSLTTTAIVYPVVLKFGVEKSEMMIFVAAGSSVVIRVLVWMLLKMFYGNVNFNGGEVGIASLLVGAMMFAGSYLLSVRIHRNKEF